VFLLAVLLHQEELLDEVLSVLVELELADSVVIESRTGLELLERDLPIFAGLRALIPGGIDFSRVVLTVVADEARGRQALDRIHEWAGEVERPEGEPPNAVLLLPISAAAFF